MTLAIDILLIALAISLVLWAFDRIDKAAKEAKRIHERNKK